ncbi:MAG: hypothetical protein EWM72_01074 [Nitrospira sp.]|nr:MAG: hypothetical protein EWM72_01074 [Nitrospira sp.]
MKLLLRMRGEKSRFRMFVRHLVFRLSIHLRCSEFLGYGLRSSETTKLDALIAKVCEGIETLKEYRTALIPACRPAGPPL